MVVAVGRARLVAVGAARAETRAPDTLTCEMVPVIPVMGRKRLLAGRETGVQGRIVAVELAPVPASRHQTTGRAPTARTATAARVAQGRYGRRLGAAAVLPVQIPLLRGRAGAHAGGVVAPIFGARQVMGRRSMAVGPLVQAVAT